MNTFVAPSHTGVIAISRRTVDIRGECAGRRGSDAVLKVRRRCSRDEVDQVLEVAVRGKGQVADRLAGHLRSHIGLVGLQCDRVRLNRNLLGELPQFQLHIHARDVVERNIDRRLSKCAETNRGDLQIVAAGQQVGKCKTPLGIGDCLTNGSGRPACDADRRVRDQASSRILHCANGRAVEHLRRGWKHAGRREDEPGSKGSYQFADHSAPPDRDDKTGAGSNRSLVTHLCEFEIPICGAIFEGNCTVMLPRCQR